MVAVLLLLAVGTTVASRTWPITDTANWPTGLRAAHSLLTLSTPLEPSVEVRRAALFIAAGAACLWLAIRARPDAVLIGGAHDALLAGVLLVASASTLWNNSAAVSLGWLLTLLAGATWMAVVRRMVGVAEARLIGWGLTLLAFVTATLAIWHQRATNIRDVTWPIGTVTTTGTLAAVFTAGLTVAVVRDLAALRAARRPPELVGPTLRVAAAALCAALLLIAARQGAILGALAGIAGAGVAALIWVVRWRGARLLGGALVTAVALGGAGYVAYLYRSNVLVKRVSIGSRFVLYHAALDAFRERPVLGWGPDGFAADATTRLARARGESPQTVIADIANAAHNEWLQALMELGLPGGLLYALLPLAVIARAWRGAAARRDAHLLTSVAIFSAALAALCATDLSSITLRTPTGPVWYWTLLGLLAALTRAAHSPAEPAASRAFRPRAIPAARVAHALLGVGLLAGAFFDLRTARAHADGRTKIDLEPLEAFAELSGAWPRFDAVDDLRTRRDAAVAATNAWLQLIAAHPATAPSRSDLDAENAAGRRAVTAWKSLYERCPGLPGAIEGLTDALFHSGAVREATQLARHVVRTTAPYSTAANLQLARSAYYLPGRFDHCCRAIRNGQIEGAVAEYLSSILPALNIDVAWAERVALARHDSTVPRAEWHDPLAGEVLRIEAWRLSVGGDLAAASRTAIDATNAYYQLVGQPDDRAHLAHMEAWALRARLIYANDPTDFAKAFVAIDLAEQRALQVNVAVIRRVPVYGEQLGGEMMPSEFPENLRATWLLSAMLHLAMDRPRYVPQRIMMSLPAGQRDSAHARRAYGALAHKLYRDFVHVEPARRPRNFDQYLPWVQEYAPDLLQTVEP
ncbi:MAG: O-antigen ligase family protein [Phycisphaerae bacterium]